MNNQKVLIETKETYCSLKSDLDKVFDCLIKYNEVVEVDSKEVWVYAHVKKLLPCFNVFIKISELDSILSMCTLLRMIVDNYSVLYLLTSYSTKNEQLLRYYLYLLDAVETRSKLVTNSSETSEECKLDNFRAIEADKIAREIIEKLIVSYDLKKIVNESIITKRNWKFKDAKSKEKFNWIQLYEIANIPPQDAATIQDYNSSFVHGLGIPLMLRDSEFINHTIYTLMICNNIQFYIIKILFQEFKEETRLIRNKINIFKYLGKIGWN